MQRALTSLGLMTLLLAGLCWLVGRSTPSPQVEPRTGLVVGEAVRHGNLTIFPVYSLLPRDADRFITLDEGLAAGTVEIREMGGGRYASISPTAPTDDGEDPFGRDTSVPRLPRPALPQADPFGDEPVEGPVDEGPVPPSDAQDQEQPGPETEGSSPGQPGVIADFETLIDLITPTVSGDSGWTDNGGGSMGNEVNRLLVINRSDKPLYLMPGEILLGGDQDRTIGQELVIAPSKEPVPIEVFCVEHGRWGQRNPAEWSQYLATGSSGRISGFSTNLSLVVSQTEDIRPETWTAAAAAETRSGKFIGSVGSLSKSARLAVQSDAEQGKVWEEVASENTKAGVQSGSGAFTGNYAEAAAVQRLEPYIEGLRRPIADTPRVVGVIVAVNGKLESLDVFESTPLFRKLWPKLLKSYALDAANAIEPGKDARPATCTHSDAVAFFNKASDSQPQKHESKSGISVASSDTDDIILFSAREESPSTQRPFAAGRYPSMDAAVPLGGFGGAIHSAGYAK